MCQVLEITRSTTLSNIVIEFERNASLRAIEIIVINRGRDGVEGQAVKLIAADSGEFTYVGRAVNLVDGVDIL